MASNPSLVTVLLAWTFDPSVVLGLFLLGWVYVTGLRTLASRGRLARAAAPWRVALFALGLLAIFLALESPIDGLSLRLFSFHMTQHLLLLMVGPPLLLLGKPVPVLLVGAPHALVRRIARAHARKRWFHGLTRLLTSPLVAWVLYVGDIWMWHIPAFYQRTLQNQGVHLLEHLCFLTTGLLFWWVIVEPLPGPPRLHHGMRLLYAWSAVLPNTALGALFAFSNTPWYPFYADEPRLWGFSIMDDQRLAGIIMWLPGDMMYVTASALLFFAMLAREERLTAQNDLADALDKPVA